MTLMFAIVIISNVVSAQAVTQDFISALSNDNTMLQMAISINDKKIEMAKLQNQLDEKNSDVKNSAKASQKAADNNQSAATVLTNDDQDKRKAKAATKAARKAEKSSSQARNAKDKLVNITRDIEKLKIEIADSEQKLKAMGGSKYLHSAN